MHWDFKLQQKQLRLLNRILKVIRQRQLLLIAVICPGIQNNLIIAILVQENNRLTSLRIINLLNIEQIDSILFHVLDDVVTTLVVS